MAAQWRLNLIVTALLVLCGTSRAAAAPDCAGYTDTQAAPTGGANFAQTQASLDGGASVDPIGGGYSLLQFAAGDGDVALTRLLLARGANTEYRDHNKDRALLWASKRGRVETVRLLLEAGSPIQSEADPYQITPLMLAVTNGHIATACLLISRGADVNKVDHANDTALLNAASSSDPRMIDMLLRAGANPNAISEHIFETPILVAAHYGHTDTIRALLRAGANMDARNYQGETALWRSAKRGNIPALTILLAQPNPRGRAAKAQRQADKNRAFVAAVWSGVGGGALLLQQNGASINAVDLGGKSAFAGVSRLPGTIMYDWFMRRGVSLAQHGNSALLEAAKLGRGDIIARLLAANIPVDSANETGQTALLAAAGRGHVTAVKVLLDAGGDPTRQDKNARDMAFLMRDAVSTIEAEIFRRKSSRAFLPTQELERELMILRQNHNAIRALIAARAVNQSR